MSEFKAVRAALEAFHVPSRVPAMRAAPLPPGLPFLLEIAAGDSAQLATAAQHVEREPKHVAEAVTFYLEQVLLHADADSYRILATTREANAIELRRNMALLLRWLHPDATQGEIRSAYAARVTRAWETLKTPERRAAYDLAHPARSDSAPARLSGSVRSSGARSTKKGKGSRPRTLSAGQIHGTSGEAAPGLLRRCLQSLLGLR